MLLYTIRQEALFYAPGDDALFHSHLPVDGVYTSHALDRLRREVAILWRETLPNTPEIVRMVEAQLAAD